jgi:uncharacterized SAM-binding protein YcdF (DUF218 family)
VLSAVATVLLVPPVNLLFVALAGVALGCWRPVAGRRLTLASLLALLLLALPAVPDLLMLGLERGIEPDASHAAPQAIVILGADAVSAGSHPAETQVGGLTLERLRGGAELARATKLPVLVTGGVVTEDGLPVAVLMARSLARDFAIPARWVEQDSGDTWDNAALSAPMLRRDGIDTVFVVTHAWHMRRALIAFRAAGLTAVPAPLLTEHAWDPVLGSFVPRMSAWARSYYALHEWIGCAWYALRARFAAPPG